LVVGLIACEQAIDERTVAEAPRGTTAALDEDVEYDPAEGGVALETVTGSVLRGLRDSDDSVCGDGTVAGIEECDDSNTRHGDGCSADCLVERVA
jgi:cysteine-rich repeat protein